MQTLDRQVPFRFAAAILFIFVLGASAVAQEQSSKSPPKPAGAAKKPAEAAKKPAEAGSELTTACEDAKFKRYTSYKDMMAYLQEVQATTTEMKLATYGKSWEDRELPYAIFSRPTVTKPWEALVSGKPIVLCHANVHGGERTLRESVLIFIRELAKKGTPANKLLDDLVILVAPQINPDGFEATPRGTRGNSWGIDMNRDYMKLEQRALYSLVKNLHNTWHPHIIIDGHNGGARPYDLCYQAHSNASPSQAITRICDEELFPYINKRMQDHGFRSFYYSGGNRERWRVGGSDPRISRNYSGFINSIGILFESPHGYQTLEKGIKAGIVGYRAVLEFAAKNPDKVMNLINKARRETVAMGEKPEGEVPVQMKYGPEDFKVSYVLRDGTEVKDALIMKKPIATKLRKRAYAYLLPRDAREAVAMLRRHNITVEVLQKTTKIAVEAYKLEDVEYIREYNHAGAVRVKVGEVVKMERRFPPGTFVVCTAQMQGRVVTHMLEPETNDNVVRWNTMDALLPKTRVGAAAIAAANARARRGNRNPGGRGGQGGNRRGRRAGDQGGQRGGNQGGRQGGNQGGRRGRDQGGRQGGNQGGRRGGDQGGRQGGNQGGRRGGDQGGRQRGGQGGQGGDQRRRRGRWGGGAGARRGNRGIGRRRPPGPPVIPIYKVMTPTPLPTRILD